MRLIAHVSDLHFGAHLDERVEGLLAALERLAPHLVVVSGDLTQRARRGQFDQARAFLARSPAPVVCVPGNHDLPFHRPIARAFSPLGRYRAALSSVVADRFVDEEMAVYGLNSARAWRWTRGRLGHAQIHAMSSWFDAHPAPHWRAAVMHHPLLNTGAEHHGLVSKAERLLGLATDTRPHLVFAGHLHHALSGYTGTGEQTLVIQAGTATSHRGRGSVNSFNVIRLGDHELALQVMCWGAGEFEAAEGQTFRREAGVWTG